MPQSFALIIVPIVSSTKDRIPILDTSIRASLHAYLATVARDELLAFLSKYGIEHDERYMWN